MENTLLNGLKAVVQYRKKNGGYGWYTMAAFDSENVAEKYAKKCAEGDPPWEYRWLLIEE